MKYITLLLVSLALLLGCCTNHPRPLSGHSSVIQPVLPVVVELRTRVVSPDTGMLTEDGTGSGVVVRSDGYVLTCYHVVRGTAEVSVESDGEDYLGEVVAFDEFLDLALVHVVSHHFDHVATWGDSSALLVGDFVFAVGYPFDLAQLASVGCVSSVTFKTRYPVIVTDAAVNPGNSGGGLFDYRGALIGIPSALYSAQGLRANTGVAYAIPSNTAHLFVNRNLK